MRNVICSNCELPAHIERGIYHFKECGLSSVFLHEIKIIRCESCGNEDPIIPNINDLMRFLAVSVILKPERLVGEEIKFLRKYLKKSGEEFSQLLDVDKTTLSKWENDADPIGDQSDRLVRVVVLITGERLREKLDEIVNDVVHCFRATPKGKKKKKARPISIDINANETTYEFA